MKSNLEPRSGPRIFVGKLNKETTENDVKVLSLARFGSHAPDVPASYQSAVPCYCAWRHVSVRNCCF